MTTPLEVLAIGPHPDDVELFVGGVMAKLAVSYRVGVVDLTRGELASQGDAKTRAREAEAAAQVLGLAHRENLDLGDGRLRADDDAAVLKMVEMIRRLRPELLLVPWVEARHPDHAAAGHLARRAAFFAGVRKLAPGAAIHRPRLLSYQMRHRFSPSVVVDVSSVYERKLEAIRCHESQVVRQGSDTLISSPRALAAIEARDRYYGAMIGVDAGEPLKSSQVIGIDDPVKLLRDNPFSEAQLFEEDP